MIFRRSAIPQIRLLGFGVIFRDSMIPPFRRSVIPAFRVALFSELLSGDVVDLVFVSREITDTLAFGFEAKSSAKRNLINSTLSIAGCQNRKKITACETQFGYSNALICSGSKVLFSEERDKHSCMQYVTRISNDDNVLSTLLA